LLTALEKCFRALNFKLELSGGSAFWSWCKMQRFKNKLKIEQRWLCKNIQLHTTTKEKYKC
jgi:hypothetical protein